MKKMQATATTLSAAIALAVVTQAQAQTPPNVGDILQQVQPMTPAISQPAAELPSIGGIQIEPPMQALPSGPRLFVRGFNIVGHRELSAESSLAVIAGNDNRELSLGELEGLATQITRHYRANGYFVARAYIPQQEVVDGIITIRVVEGNYGQFHLNNESLVKDHVVQAMLDDVKGYDIVSLDTLERAMLIINDTPGVQVVRADVMPGEKVGTSDFAVGTAATERHNGYILADNYGSRYTGRNRVGFNYDLNSPTGRGDRLTLGGLLTEDSGILNGRIAYSTLLMPNGLRGQVEYSQTEYELGDLYAPLDATGSAKAWDFRLSYPIRRIRAQTIEGTLALSSRDLEDRIDSTDTRTPKRLDSLTAGINVRDERRLLGFAGLTSASFSLTAGNLDIEDAEARALDAAGADTQGDYYKLNLSLSRISLLPAQFSLTTSLHAQRALNGKNLDGSERMSVSGVSGVYAYPSTELSGSHAALLKAELSRPLPAIAGLQHQWSVFATHGYADSAKSVGPDDRSRTLDDVGLGWRGQYQGFVLNTHLAYRLEGAEPLSEKADRARFLVQAGWVF